MKSLPRRTTTRWTLLGSLLGAVVLLGLTLQNPQSGSTEAGGSATIPSPSSGRNRGRIGPATHSQDARPGALVELAEETTPLQALPAGTVPVSQVDPPPPDPTASVPSPPVEPPNPAKHRPPIHNPGGVSRDRPERPAPDRRQ